MNKREFMQKLKDNLIGLNQNDKREVLLDYEEHFLDGKNNGRSEEEICQALGDPKKIAADIMSQNKVNAPNNEGMNTAGYIIGIILLGAACLGLASIVVSMLAGAISGIFGAVAVAAIVPNTLLKVAAISAVIFVVAFCVIVALLMVKLIPLVVKWFKQMYYSLEGKKEEAKNIQKKSVKIHAVVWILLVLLCVASICGAIIGSIGFAKQVVTDLDSEDIHELSEMVRDISYDHGHWVYYGEESMDDFEEAMEDFAEDMEDFAEDMEETFDEHDGWVYRWKIIFGD